MQAPCMEKVFYHDSTRIAELFCVDVPSEGKRIKLAKKEYSRDASRIFLLPATSHEPHPVPIILHELKPHEHCPVALPPPVGVEHRAFDRILFYVHMAGHDLFEHEHCPLHVILGRY